MIRLATPDDIPELEALAKDLLRPECSPPFKYIGHPGYFCVIVPDGFLFARKDEWNNTPVAFVISAASRKTVPHTVRKQAFLWLNAWAVQYKLTKILAFTRTPEVFLKRWGFQLESFVISKEVVL